MKERVKMVANERRKSARARREQEDNRKAIEGKMQHLLTYYSTRSWLR